MSATSEESADEHTSPSSSSSAPRGSQSLAVRSRNGITESSTSKRKRANTTNGGHSASRRRTVDPADDDDIYDPDQPREERRKLQKEYRELLRDITENRDEYLKSDSRGLTETIKKADALSKKLRQTAQATIDSRLLVSTTDISYRKTLRLTQGSLSQGLDVDDFLSKCIMYMRHGRGLEDDNATGLSSTQRQRRVPRRSDDGDGDDDEVGDDGDMMHWSHLGRFACLPYIRRPALPGFLLGPLSVEKKVRKITKRSAPFRPDNLTETRPEVLNVDDLSKKENDLTAICKRILEQLMTVQEEAQTTAEQRIKDDMTEDETLQIMHEVGLRSTGGLDLMKFVVNPRSFGQTVENMFYVSFLIRDGRVEIEFDENDLPSLAPVRTDADEDDEKAHKRGAAKHQAILSMDMQTWRDIIDTFQLTESMIEHRDDDATTRPGAKGWYS